MELLSSSNGTISQNLSKVRAIRPIRLLVLISLWSMTNQIVWFALILNVSSDISLVASWALSFYLLPPFRDHHLAKCLGSGHIRCTQSAKSTNSIERKCHQWNACLCNTTSSKYFGYFPTYHEDDTVLSADIVTNLLLWQFLSIIRCPKWQFRL